MEVPGPGIEFELQLQPTLQLKQAGSFNALGGARAGQGSNLHLHSDLSHCRILIPLCHSKNSHSNIVNPYHMPDILDPECVKMYKTVLSLRSYTLARECNRKFLTGGSLVNVIDNRNMNEVFWKTGDKSICPSQAGKFFKMMFILDNLYRLKSQIFLNNI